MSNELKSHDIKINYVGVDIINLTTSYDDRRAVAERALDIFDDKHFHMGQETPDVHRITVDGVEFYVSGGRVV